MVWTVNSFTFDIWMSNVKCRTSNKLQCRILTATLNSKLVSNIKGCAHTENVEWKQGSWKGYKFHFLWNTAYLGCLSTWTLGLTCGVLHDVNSTLSLGIGVDTCPDGKSHQSLKTNQNFIEFKKREIWY